MLLLQLGYAVIDLVKLMPSCTDDLCLSRYTAWILQVTVAHFLSILKESCPLERHIGFHFVCQFLVDSFNKFLILTYSSFPKGTDLFVEVPPRCCWATSGTSHARFIQLFYIVVFYSASCWTYLEYN